MNSMDSVLLSVSAEARQLVAPDCAVLDGQIEHTAGSNEEAVGSVSASLERLTADLAALGAVPFDEDAGNRPLTWSAHSWATRQERYQDQETGRVERSGQVTATVALRVTVRDLDLLDGVTAVLSADPALSVHGVMWEVDWDNPAWKKVRAAAISAAVGKAGDYAAALGATVRHIEHVADTGLLSSGTGRPSRALRASAAGAFGGGDQPGFPALTPVPQELMATIEARFRTTEIPPPTT
jgi:uncharacterized protein YggE